MAKKNVLITDQFNNRVIEVDPITKEIAWSFGSGDPDLCNPGVGSVIAPNDAHRLSRERTIIAGTGTSTCPDNRVIIVDENGKILWQYGQAGVAGNGPNELSTPVYAVKTSNGNVLITYQANNRIIEVNPKKKIVWSYGPMPKNLPPGVMGVLLLNNPNSALFVKHGHILIADENNNRVIEITRGGRIVWEYSEGINTAAFAIRLSNGNTLITDSGNARIVEVSPDKKVVWEYFTNTGKDSNPNPSPSNAVRLSNGNTIITDQFNHR